MYLLRLLEDMSVRILWNRSCSSAWIADLVVAALVLAIVTRDGRWQAAFAVGYTDANGPRSVIQTQNIIISNVLTRTIVPLVSVSLC